MHRSRVPSVVRRLPVAFAAAVFGTLLATASVAANEPTWVLPEDDSEVRTPALAPAPLAPQPLTEREEPRAQPPDATSPTPRPAPSTTPAPTRPPTPAPADPEVGYDISYPQCGEEYPESFAFAVVGVNGGRVFSPNPCFGPDGDGPSQLEWAGPDADLYFNTGNPGPRISRYWPSGQDEPRKCDGRASDRDSVDCSYVYGWNAAAFAYGQALDAFIEVGWAEEDADRLPGEPTIWLDVEPANSWRRDRDRNIAALEGAVAYLESMEVDRIGFYSTPRLWDRITGGTDRFAEHPAWHAGARDLQDAERRCEDEQGFTGGELVMVQWVEDGLDHNIRCEEIEPGR